ncbi:MAG: hypothetical protein JNN15_05070 [Blastocatellia bacterium]|nr:hypothetical protein [Blastocatellia bacterium]
MADQAKIEIESQEKIERALEEVRRLLYGFVEDTISSNRTSRTDSRESRYGDDFNRELLNELEKKNHIFELRALESEKRSTILQKKFVDIKAKLEAAENELGQSKDRVIITEAKAVELESQLDNVKSELISATIQMEALQVENQVLRARMQEIEAVQIETERKASEAETKAVDLQAKLQEAERRAEEAEERAISIYKNVTEKIRELQSKKNS